MQANIGDRVIVKGRVIGRTENIGVGEVVEVRGADGEAPYLVRFENGYEALVSPGPDCIIEPRISNQ